ncbi:hypothetical protein C2S51_015012 [Perilla frutescens var. frutescens]|nr:hypothetical protein C2S51_015012 [Perilla frutescens var. frutescens]
MIEQSRISRSTESSLLTSATDDEIHVAQTLLDIAGMIRILESGPGLKWGAKKRRSKSPYHKTDVGVEETPPPQPKSETAAAASPVTPLAFPPSESDEQRSKHLFHRTSKNMSREVYVDMIEELSQRRDLLRGEIENVTSYYNKLIAYNSQLKAMKQEVLRKEEPKLETTIDGNLAMELIPKNHKMSSIGLVELYNGLGFIKNVAPFGIPDLNVSAEEIIQPLDRSRAIADRRSRSAEARRRRMDIIRVKSLTMSLRSVCGFKFPRTR